jgi:hypothetical protein
MEWPFFLPDQIWSMSKFVPTLFSLCHLSWPKLFYLPIKDEGRLNNSFQNIQVPMSQAYDCYLCGKGDSANVMKLRILDDKIILSGS